VTVNRKADFFTKRIDSTRFVILIDSNRESECSTKYPVTASSWRDDLHLAILEK